MSAGPRPALNGTPGSGRPSRLLERSGLIAALDEGLAGVGRTSRGQLILIGGEAGAGKTAVVRHFCAQQTRAVPVLSGSCDALFTPRPLGPIIDIAQIIGGEFDELVHRGSRPYEIAAALMRALLTPRPSIVILEDLHWADDATLDVLRLIARRIETVPALVLATYRDDELDRLHPLRILLGEIATGSAVTRLNVGPLSPSAVAELAEPFGVDPQELHRKTGGNAFFVTEALLSADLMTPPTVRDAVLARAARLSKDAIRLLEMVAVIPPQVDSWALEALAGDIIESLDEGLSSGMLTSNSAGVAFRHELARLAIEESLTPVRRMRLHRRALQVLSAPPVGSPDLARIAHHADAAADREAVLRFAPAAAAHASALGAHREAAAQYARAVRFADGLTPAERAELLALQAHECFLICEFDASIAAGYEAVRHFREAGDRRRLGAAMNQISHHLRCAGRTTEAEEMGRQSLLILEEVSSSAGRELAMAYSNLAFLSMNADDAESTANFGRHALELAEVLDATDVIVSVLNNLGTMELLNGAIQGRAKLERSLEIALRAGLDEDAGRAYINMAWAASRSRSYIGLERHLQAGLEYCSERGLLLWRLYVLAYGARCALDQGRWPEAGERAQEVLRHPEPLPGIPALAVVGLIRARRGDPDSWQPLDEARSRAEQTPELQHIAPVAAARAEVAWLEGKPDAVAAETESTLVWARRQRAAWVVGELACWRWRAGVSGPETEGAAEPYALEMSGKWAEASQFWTERSCPYEAALALASSNEPDAMRRALTELQRLGARSSASIVARHLRELGVAGVARGPRPSTRSNAAHLTDRQIEILEFVAQGLRNAEIAERLSLSARTVDHHVSAILYKLNARSRGEASELANRLGVQRSQNRQPAIPT